MEHQGTKPLPVASLTKVATTLAALETWGPNHQFVTTVRSNGTIRNGVLTGDLIIQGGGDSLFTWEDGIALGNGLQQLGIQTVKGKLVITEQFCHELFH
ncbi:MAG: D-alanyl-D-alanine carboxypeptidase [Cyanobacteria bacterium LVE1205-1]|jgi:D-alanyl-D-alanine carboxypeptidase/D-alanyl-D-alanine-endopeptidase (penicillin-binding protein 4)